MASRQPLVKTELTHFYWIDLIRVAAVFQVILVHLSYVIFFKEDILSLNWVAANFYDSLSRTGVPLFFMVSGFLLLGKIEPIPAFFRKRFVKVGIPALFWTVAYLFWSVEAYRGGEMNPIGIALSMLKAIFVGEVEIHLWFLYILIGLYLAVPILRVYVSTASRRDLTYFVVLWFIATSLLEGANRLTGFQTALVIPVVTGYVGYFLLGHFLVDVKISRRGRFLAGFCLVAAVAVTFLGTNMLSMMSELPIDAYFYSYFSPPTVLASACAFLLLKDLGKSLGKLSRLIRTVSETSFGIFLIHIFVIEILRNGDMGFRLYSWMGPTFYMIPLTGIAVFTLSFLIVFILRKIPILRILVP